MISASQRVYDWLIILTAFDSSITPTYYSVHCSIQRNCHTSFNSYFLRQWDIWFISRSVSFKTRYLENTDQNTEKIDSRWLPRDFRDSLPCLQRLYSNNVYIIRKVIFVTNKYIICIAISSVWKEIHGKTLSK